jgi:hypothetical protein
MNNDWSAEWVAAKAAEREATARRRGVEDKILAALDLPPDFEGVTNFEAGGYTVKISARMNRKVDADRVQDIATENGTADQLQYLFRWKPEINAAAWKAADKSITDPLMFGITTTPGRASFSISIEDE